MGQRLFTEVSEKSAGASTYPSHPTYTLRKKRPQTPHYGDLEQSYKVGAPGIEPGTSRV
jgi:hypothetical protein